MTILAAHPESFDQQPAPTTRVVGVTRSARRFVQTLAVSYFLSVVGVVGFCVYVNSSGSFGPVGYLDVRKYNDRYAKVKYLSELEPSQRPEVLIMGSSNLFSIRAGDVEEMTGRRAFNGYVTGSLAEDSLCLLSHFVYDLDYRPELLIVGLETWTFQPEEHESKAMPGFFMQLLNVPELAQHHPGINMLQSTWSKVKGCFSPEHLATSWRMLTRKDAQRQAWTPLLECPWYRSDGSVFIDPNRPHKFAGTYYKLDKDGHFGITQAMTELVDRGQTQRLKHLSFFDWSGLSKRRIQWFDQFLSLCQENDIEVILVINPVHPVMWQILQDETPHRANLNDLLDQSAAWEAKYSVIRGTFDATHISSFGGDPDDFFDSTHCGLKNANRLLQHIAAKFYKR